MSREKPRGRYDALTKVNPDVTAAYERLAEECGRSGPLDARDVALLKVGISVGLGSWRSVHAHARKALQKGVAPDAVRQVALIALPTVGLPAALDALKWIEEILEEHDARTAPAIRT
jgi:alkylhydroperoxidase/carboxymuconolactone decarboxylase family protein YurZ